MELFEAPSDQLLDHLGHTLVAFLRCLLDDADGPDCHRYLYRCTVPVLRRLSELLDPLVTVEGVLRPGFGVFV